MARKKTIKKTSPPVTRAEPTRWFVLEKSGSVTKVMFDSRLTVALQVAAGAWDTPEPAFEWIAGRHSQYVVVASRDPNAAL